jgi:hypothetical protein
MRASPIRGNCEAPAENFLDALSNSGLVVRRYSEGKKTGPPKAVTGEHDAAIFGC